eukprot:527718_1
MGIELNMVILLTLDSTYGYMIGPNATIWSDAQNYCESLGSNLASIHSEIDYYTAAAQCSTGGRSNGGFMYSDGCWIGLSDILSKGLYTYIDQTECDYGCLNGSTTQQSPPWFQYNSIPAQYQPSNDYEENCIEMIWAYDLTWWDAKCDSKSYPLCNDTPSPTISPTTPTTSPTPSPFDLMTDNCDEFVNKEQCCVVTEKYHKQCLWVESTAKCHVAENKTMGAMLYSNYGRNISGNVQISSNHSFVSSHPSELYSSDEWTLKQLYPYKGKLLRPLVDPFHKSYLYAYRVYSEGIQLIKFETTSFTIIWFRILSSNSSSMSTMVIDLSIFGNFEQYYLIADTKPYLHVLSPQNGSIIWNKQHDYQITFYDDKGKYSKPGQGWIYDTIKIFYTDNKLIRIYSDGTHLASYECYSDERIGFAPVSDIKIEIYNIRNGNVLLNTTLISSVTNYTFMNIVGFDAIDDTNFYLYGINPNDHRLYSWNLNSINCISDIEINWVNQDIYSTPYQPLIIDNYLETIYIIASYSIETDNVPIYIYSIDLHSGDLKSRFKVIPSDTGPTDWSDVGGANISFKINNYDYEDKYIVYPLKKLWWGFVLSQTGQDLYYHYKNNLYKFTINDGMQYVGEQQYEDYVHTIMIDKNDNILLVFSTNIGTCSCSLGTGEKHECTTCCGYRTYANVTSLAVVNKNFHTLWSKDYEGNFNFDSNVKYLQNAPTAFGDNIWYTTDSEVNKFIVYGKEENNQSYILLDWQFWVSTILQVITLVLFLTICFCKWRTKKLQKRHKHDLELNNLTKYRKLDDNGYWRHQAGAFGDKKITDITVEYIFERNLEKINYTTVISSIGLFIMAIILTFMQFQNIDDVDKFLNDIGTYDHFRNTYLNNHKMSTSNDSSINDLCFCTSSRLDIINPQCIASDCNYNSYDCDNIIDYYGACDLSFYQWECNCELMAIGCDITMNNNTNMRQSIPNKLYDNCFHAYYNVKVLLWCLYFTHIVGTVLYILFASITCCKFGFVGWITRISSVVSAILLIYTSGTLNDSNCTGPNKLFGYSYPGCFYNYPNDFEGTFMEFERNVYVSISTILLIYGMKTILKAIQVWIPYHFAVGAYCCFK